MNGMQSAHSESFSGRIASIQFENKEGSVFAFDDFRFWLQQFLGLMETTPFSHAGRIRVLIGITISNHMQIGFSNP